ncbi:hypothetical protein [uncultured Methanofollis sp.]|uniref:hypothetical protein n=1 Tax=uncultured Methanofollis sp. TaxID=262500 RepID=UPI002606EFA0|nr:hypothetical protein [uncultured Methanofollis sp.]
MKKALFVCIGILLISWGCSSPVTAVDADTVVKNYVSIDQARTNANGVLSDFVSKGPLQENEVWKDVVINESPITIYDPNGLKLYYLFTVERKGTPIGEVEVPASKVLGSPVSSVSLKPHTRDFDRAEDIAKTLADENYPDYKITSIKPVDYAPSHIGAMAELFDPGNESYTRIVVDAHTFDLVPEDMPPGAEGRYGAVCIESLYDSLSEEGAEECIRHRSECHEETRSSRDLAGDGNHSCREQRGVSPREQEIPYSFCMPALFQMIADLSDMPSSQG